MCVDDLKVIIKVSGLGKEGVQNIVGAVPGPSSAHGSRCPAHEASQRLSYRPPPSDDDTPSPGRETDRQTKSSQAAFYE